MTTDNAKPAVITAAEFVAKRYAERIAAGECVVRGFHGDVQIVNVTEQRLAGVSFFTFQWEDSDKEIGSCTWSEFQVVPMRVHWFPVAASSTDADEVARLRAEVARLRGALEEIREEAANQGVHAKTMTTKNIAVGLGIAARIARAALETGEAQS